MKKISLKVAARVLLGLIFFVFGLNGFLQFMPMPDMSLEGGMFMMALMSSGYLMTVVKGIEVIGGVLLLSGNFVPLALCILAPVIVNIFLFHIFLEPAGIPMAVILVVLESYLVFVGYKGAFKGIFQRNAN